MTRLHVAVVGHLEWTRLGLVDHPPARGEIVGAQDGGEIAAGGGGIAAVQLAKLAGESSFYTALGDDDAGDRAIEQLGELGVHVHAARRGEPTRRAVVLLDAGGERTITTIGQRIVPHGDDDLAWDELAGFDAVYLTAADPGGVRAARNARVLVATPRAQPALGEAAARLDALVLSANDREEEADAAGLVPAPDYLVRTSGHEGGAWTAADGRTGTWAATSIDGPVLSTYGAGDSFAAALTYGLAESGDVTVALGLAARAAAAVLTGHGPYEGQLVR